MGFVPNMRVPCTFYVNELLQKLMFEELEQFVSRGEVGGFLPAVKQLANVAALPGTSLDGCLSSPESRLGPPAPAQASWAPPSRFLTCTAVTDLP
jgi:hypothetical protein